VRTCRSHYVPICDIIMHLILILATLLLSLYCGTFKCDKDDDKSTWFWAALKGQKWEVHGAAVASCRCYLPGSLERPLRNPAEIINSVTSGGSFSSIFWLRTRSTYPRISYQTRCGDTFTLFSKAVASYIDPGHI
jgi:hypothetical protein